MEFEINIDLDNPAFPAWLIKGMTANAMYKLYNEYFYHLNDLARNALRYKALDSKKEAQQVEGYFKVLRYRVKWVMNNTQQKNWFVFCRKNLLNFENDIRFYADNLIEVHGQKRPRLSRQFTFL